MKLCRMKKKTIQHINIKWNCIIIQTLAHLHTKVLNMPFAFESASTRTIVLCVICWKWCYYFSYCSPPFLPLYVILLCLTHKAFSTTGTLEMLCICLTFVPKLKLSASSRHRTPRSNEWERERDRKSNENTLNKNATETTRHTKVFPLDAISLIFCECTTCGGSGSGGGDEGGDSSCGGVMHFSFISLGFFI